MNLGLPNQIAAPNRRLRFGLVPWSFGFFMSQGSAVGELDVRRECPEVLNRRKLRERRGDLNLRLLRCLLLIIELVPRMGGHSFRVFGVFRGYISGGGGNALAATAVPSESAGDFRNDDWIAEPDHCSQRREAPGICREVMGRLESSARRG